MLELFYLTDLKVHTLLVVGALIKLTYRPQANLLFFPAAGSMLAGSLLAGSLLAGISACGASAGGVSAGKVSTGGVFAGRVSARKVSAGGVSVGGVVAGGISARGVVGVVAGVPLPLPSRRRGSAGRPHGVAQ
ncbi:unnamed protein product [Closterium sp. NIES-64]|nr:unnamed protein product [Closterium sp. NIES-64]